MNTTKRLVWRKITDMYVQCSYPMRPDAIAMSGCCRHRARTAVERPDDARMWRCREHEGMVSPGVTGAVKDAVRVRWEDWMTNVAYSETEDGEYVRHAYFDDEDFLFENDEQY